MSEKPLNGLRVLDFTELAAGPFMTQCLAELGADVTKIERPPHGDSARTLMKGGFKTLNVDKHSRFANLKEENTAAEILELALNADVLVEGYRPGVMERLGFGYERLRVDNSRLIYVSISGYGQTGPLANRPGHDINYMATAGVISLCGGLSQPPSDAVGIPISDFCASLYAMSSLLAALLQVNRTGQGQWLDIAIVDCLTHWMNAHLGQFQCESITTLQAQRQAVFCKPGYGVFATSDGAYVAVAALEDHFWIQLKQALQPNLEDIECETYAARMKHAAKINSALAAVIACKDADEVVMQLTLAGVPASNVMMPNELANTPHSVARNLFGQVDGINYARYPVKMVGGVGLQTITTGSKPPPST